MSFIHIPKSWHIPASQATPEDIYLARRRLMKTMGFGGINALGVLIGCDNLNAWRPDNPNQDAISLPSTGAPHASRTQDLYPAHHNPAFTLDRPLTPEYTTNNYSNVYEFSVSWDVNNYVHKFRSRPWEV